MKLLLVSDVHLDSAFTWATPDVGRQRRAAIRACLEAAATQASVNKADAFLVAGDLYEHEYVTPDTSAFLRSLFASLDMPVLIAPGNHDWVGPQSVYMQEKWTANVHVFTDDKLTPFTVIDGFTVWGAAHRAPANTDGFLENFAVDRGGVNVALFHGSEQGTFGGQDSGKVPHAPFSADQIPRAGLKHAFVGHFHKPHLGPWHTYPGNPEPLSFGETGDRGAVLAEVTDNGAVSCHTLPIAVSSVHDITVDITGVTNSSEALTRVRDALAPLTGTVRATINGDIDPDVDIRVDDFRALGRNLDAFVPRLGQITEAYDIDALEAETTVRGQFVRDVLSSDLDKDMRRRVLVTGLRALDGRGHDLDVH